MDRSLIIPALVISCGFSAYAQRPEIAPNRDLIRPYRGLAYTEKDIPAVRELVVNGKNRALVERIFDVTEEWMKRSNEEIVALVPKPGSLFAYGSAGDPKTGQDWPRFGVSGICSLERPGEVRSPHTGDVYGIQKPGEPYYDKGDGWTRPEDGQRFYFKGIWNSFVIDSLHSAVDHMALAYLLSGDARIAEKALFILDHLAALRVQMPIAGYSVADWPHPTASHLKKGFFRYMGNLANQRVINTFLALDLLGNAPFASAPSAYTGRDGKKRTVLENIIKNYFDIYEEWYLEEGALTNHATILIGNVLAHGVFFGDAKQLRQGIDGTYAFLENTINRDGDYIEVSGSYGRLGRDYGGRMIALLANYRPENYPNAKDLPSAAEYPYSLRFGNDPRWYRTAVEMLYRLPIMGRFPQHGDMTPDRNVLLNRDNEWLAKSRTQYLRMLYQQTTREEWKREIEVLYAKAAKQKQSPPQIEDLLLYGISLWAEPEPPQEQTEIVEKSELIGAKRIAVLRDGKGRNQRALFMRGGMNSYHGHDDQMAVVPYGHGMMLQGEYGYRWAGTPDHLGWGSRAVGHLTAVVNEDLPAPYLFKGYNLSTPAPAADVTGFLGRPPAQFVEMSNPRLWPKAGLKDYRRTAWLIGIDETRYYFVDFFQILGGKTHDYVWTAPFAQGADDDAFQLEGVEPASTNGVWTLASLSGAHRRKPWNQPGQSWGERLDGSGGKVLPLPNEKELPTTKWNPEPGNGYGMIWGVKSQKTEEDWQATWKLVDNRHFLKAQFLNFDGMTAVTAKAPTLSREHHFDVTVGRREGDPRSLRSRFANVVQVGQSDDWPLIRTERVSPSASVDAKDAAAVRVELPNGDCDIVLASRQVQEVHTEEARMVGRNAFARLNTAGELVNLAMQEATVFEAGNWKIEAASAAVNAKVVAVETREESSRLTIDAKLPEGRALAGAMLLISGRDNAAVPTSANEYYSVETVERAAEAQSTLVFEKQSLVGGYFHVSQVIPGTSKVNLAWRNEVAGLPGSFAYQGQAVVPAEETAAAPLALVRKVAYREVEFTSVAGITPGKKLKALTAKPGDDVTLPLTVTVQRDADGDVYHLSTTAEITITLSGMAKTRLLVSVAGGEEREIARADAEGRLVASLAPETVGSAEMHLRLERF